MLRRIDLRGRTPGTIEIRGLLPRAPVQVESALASVGPICDDVRARGALAVREITKRFDGVELTTLRVRPQVLAAALADLDDSVRAALVEAARRARLVHEAQLHADVDIEVAPGGRVRERWVPVRRVGLYVPGGLVAYPSSVVMNVVPAQVAGVESLAVASPPQKAFGGLPHPAVLAACALLGIDEVYAVGGAQAIALFAYGSTRENGEAIEPVDVVTGPGNVYVAAAKRLVKGVVGIDSEAGPTEIGILADDSANPAYLAADLIAQAEHDELASCLLVTDSAELLDHVDAELDVQVPATRHVERVQAALSGQSAYVLVDDIEVGLHVVDAWAAEHLEVVTRDAQKVADRVRNAGAIFVGTWSPVSLGDYLAGSNHVLPTGGTARFTGGLSVQAFQRMIHVIDYDRDALAEVAPLIDSLGGAEDLAAHVAAVRIRVPQTGAQ
jgi:histidinol dehydrogenase